MHSINFGYAINSVNAELVYSIVVVMTDFKNFYIKFK